MAVELVRYLFSLRWHLTNTFEKAQSQGQRPNLSHIPSILFTDCTFLNSPHSHLNSWIKAIQAVTKLTRDVSSGTASQEINLRLSLKKALEGIEVPLRGEKAHGKLVERVRCLREWREQYEQLAVMTSSTRGLGIGLWGDGGVGGGKVMKELKEGYEVVKRKVDVLDVSVDQRLSFLPFAVSE